MTDAANRIEIVFTEAIRYTDADQRAAYLAEACEGDDQLRERVQALLNAHDEAGSFMASPNQRMWRVFRLM